MESLQHKFLNRLKPIHTRIRNRKTDIFLDLVGELSGDRLLDVGGGAGIDGEFLRLYGGFDEVVIVNLHQPALRALDRKCISCIIGDGCALPFASGSFDWVFSNAVIEHVGDWEKQTQFANEIRRVASKGYFVTTPNKFFPIEPHTLLPFYQFLSPAQQRYFVRLSVGYMREPLPIHLLSARDLGLLFPEARICKIGLPIFPSSLLAMRRVQS